MNKLRVYIYEILEVTENKQSLSYVYDKLMIFFIILSIIPICFKEQNPVLNMINKITTIIFILDYFLRFITADIKFNKKSIISFIKYPFTFHAIIDLVSILPTFVKINAGLKLLRLFRLFKAFKALKILRYSKSFELILNVIGKEKNILFSVIFMATIYIFLSALIMFSVEPESFDSFFEALYWATTALTTVGYGDIYPKSDIGKFVSMISSVFGIAIVALPTSIITAEYTSQLNSRNEKKED